MFSTGESFFTSGLDLFRRKRDAALQDQNKQNAGRQHREDGQDRKHNVGQGGARLDAMIGKHVSGVFLSIIEQTRKAFGQLPGREGDKYDRRNADPDQETKRVGLLG